MEIIETLAAGLMFILVAAALMQVVTSYSLDVISQKNELPGFVSFLAWIPLLNIYTMIRCGDGNFLKFLLGSIVCTVAMGAGAGLAAGSEAGALGSAAAIGIFLLIALVYMASILMTTAANRGLSKGVGLLAFVPLLGIFVYPYIAFHDGFRGPSKVGLVLGLLLAFGPLPGQVLLVEQAMATARQYEGVLAAATDGSGFDADALQNAMGELGASMESMEMGDSVSTLQDAQPTSEQQRELEESLRGMLGDVADAAPADAPTPYEAMPAAPDTLVGDRTGRGPDAPPASAASALTASIGRNGDRGFATPETPACPPGTQPKGSGPPDGLKRWCARVGADEGMKHGWLTAWHENQEMAVAGEYREGIRVGVWTRWYPSGAKRVQAEFTDGLQHGALIAWDEQGEKVYEGRFSAGLPIRR